MIKTAHGVIRARFFLLIGPYLSKKNVLTAGKKAKAVLAAKSGDMAQARTLFASVCKQDPMDTEAWTKLSLIEKGLGNYAQAEHCARRALVLDPTLGYGHYALGQALHSQQQHVGAIKSYRAAIQKMPDFADAHYLLGLALQEQGAVPEAMVSFQQALQLRPGFFEPLAELGTLHIDLGHVGAGLDCLQRAHALRPMDAIALGNIGHALRLQGDSQAALAHLRRACRLASDNIDLLAGLAGMLEKMGEIEEAQRWVEQGLQQAPTHWMTNLVAAQLDRRAKLLQQAADRLEIQLARALPVHHSADTALELGQIYDQMGDAARAFPLIVEGKRKKAMATSTPQSEQDSKAYLNQLARIRGMASPALAAVLQSQAKSATPGGGPAAVPVFLIGFPRSGTTLLEQILDSHPGIQAMEEKPTVSCMVNRALEMLDTQACELTDLREEQLIELRQLYFAEAAKYVALQPGNLLIDKMPLNAVMVPIIARVFPSAKFILALRHPGDVVLSCLMQSFAANASMANFLTLHGTVQFYMQVMGTWQHYAQQLPLQFHAIRYEDLIEDVPTQSRALLNFLGLPWDDAVLQHTEHARQRGAINTPSYHQVVQPIYQRSKYRWKRYEQQLSDVLPLLQPFVAQFGYQ